MNLKEEIYNYIYDILKSWLGSKKEMNGGKYGTNSGFKLSSNTTKS